MAALQLFSQIDAFWPLRSRTHVWQVAIETGNTQTGLRSFSVLDELDAAEKEQKDTKENRSLKLALLGKH